MAPTRNGKASETQINRLQYRNRGGGSERAIRTAVGGAGVDACHATSHGRSGGKANAGIESWPGSAVLAWSGWQCLAQSAEASAGAGAIS